VRRILSIAALLLLASCQLWGQEFSKLEAFGGFEYVNFDAFGIQRVNLLGWNGQATYYFHKNVGLTADVGGAYGSPNVGGYTNHIHSYSFNFGPTMRLSPSGTTPFIHALFGATHTDVDSGALTGNSFSFALGGGYDAGLSKTVALRVFQFDWMHTGYNYALGNRAQEHVRLSTGLVFKF
jgi:hypothetical protein